MKWIERSDGNHYSAPYRIYRGVMGYSAYIYAQKSACLAQQIASLDHAKKICNDHQAKQKQLHQRSEVMNPPASAAQGAEARNLNTEPCHRDFGLSLEGAQKARPASAPPLSHQPKESGT